MVVASTPVVLGAAETGEYPDLLTTLLGATSADIDNKVRPPLHIISTHN